MIIAVLNGQLCIVFKAENIAQVVIFHIGIVEGDFSVPSHSHIRIAGKLNDGIDFCRICTQDNGITIHI